MAARIAKHIVCPVCDTAMTIYGHDKNAWHTDIKGKTSIRKYYVSCQCGQVLQETQTLTPQPEKTGRNILESEIKAVNENQIEIAFK